jgi:hypothetical protein
MTGNKPLNNISLNKIFNKVLKEIRLKWVYYLQITDFILSLSNLFQQNFYIMQL